MRREGQVRLDWDGTFIDLFFAYHEFHSACRARWQRFALRGVPVWVVSAEDLAVFKLLFNRGRDWDDIRQMLAMQREQFDSAYVRSWAVTLVGEDDGRIARLDALAREFGAGPPPNALRS